MNQKLANRLHLAGRDMREAQSYLRALRAVVPQPRGEFEGPLWGIETAAYVAIIVVYSRPFRKSLSGGLAEKFLDPTALGIFAARPDLARVHKQITEARDEAVAHADWQHHKTWIEADENRRPQRSSTIPFYTRHIELGLLDQLLAHVREWTETKAREIDKQGAADQHQSE